MRMYSSNGQTSYNFIIYGYYFFIYCLHWLTLCLFIFTLKIITTMVVIEELKLNKFIPVAIPCNKTYFSRFGETNPISSQYSGDEDLPECLSKIDAIRDEDRRYRDFIPPTESEHE